MEYLSLFSGVGGGDLGLQHELDWTCKGYVEYEKYCQKVLKQRIKDGFLSAKDKNRTNRLKAIGNGQVSACTALTWKILGV